MRNAIKILHLVIFILLFLPTAIFAQDTTLKAFANFPFGASINTTLLQNNTGYRNLVTKEFNSVTAENVMKMATIHPSINSYNYTSGDLLVNYAEANGKRVHGHTLVWHNSLPSWVTNFVGDSTAWENLLRTHITNVVTHYKGRLVSWDVVNEAFLDDGTLRNSIWLQHLGNNYVARCFQYAHDADPDALLFYNDYGHEYSVAKLNAIAALVNTLKLNGVPVHGVGLQLHMNKNTNNNSILNAFTVMAQTGLKVHVSELDISMNPENNQALTYTPAIAQQQSDKYKFVIRAYKSIPAAQQFGITTWNVSDADTWITGTYSRPDWPLPFDNLYQRKQAYLGIIEGLNSNWTYDAASARSSAGTYTDLGTNGTAITTNFAGEPMTFDNDNSSLQEIGFNFSYNGSTYTQFVLNTNGYIKLGALAPSMAFYATSNGNTNSIITAPDMDVIYPYNHDLLGNVNAEYRVYTSGTVGTRVCTIQYKNLNDKLSPLQYANMQFQVKLYERTGIIEFVYGSWIASANANTLVTAAIGIKGLNSTNTVNLAKGSTAAWSSAVVAGTFFFLNGDYATAGPQFNSRNTALPDAGRTYRFLPLVETVLPVKLAAFSASRRDTEIFLQWLTADEKNNRNFELQRSADAATFKTIGTLAAKSGASSNTYSYADHELFPSSVYYRLKQNDLDGNSAYSQVLTVTPEGSTRAFSIKAENPIRENLRLQVNAKTSGQLLITLTNAQGLVVIRKSIVVNQGNSIINSISTAALPSGMYILRAQKGEEQFSLRLMKPGL